MRSVITNIKLIVFSLLISLSGCATVNTYYQKLTNDSPITEAEYFASMPTDIHPESRGRLPIVNRADLVVRQEIALRQIFEKLLDTDAHE